MRVRLGLKLWSTNTDLIPEVLRLSGLGSFDYVELFCVPGSAVEVGRRWKSLGLDYVVHAPHSMAGLNFSVAAMESRNKALALECLGLAELLGADTVIFHPGIGGALEETIRQASALRDPRMAFENKPKIGLDGSTCVGYLPEDLREISESLGARTCLDFGHAVAAANASGVDPIELVGRFLELKPAMFHLTDGDYAGRVDQHLAYGRGGFPLRTFLSMVPDGARVTDEAKREDPGSLREFQEDRVFLESLR